MAHMNPTVIADVLEQAGDRVPHQKAVVVDGAERTFLELRDNAYHLARQLQGLGIRRGDHVACLLPNSVEFVEVFYAAALVGAVLVPINTWYRQDEFEFVLGQSDARMLITMDAFLGTSYANMVATAIPNVTQADGQAGLRSERFPMLRTVVVVGSEVAPGAISYRQLMATVEPRESHSLTTVAPSAPALIMYTSGTTSFPKGALLPAGGVVRDAVEFGQRLQLEQGSAYYCPAPFFHAGGAIFVLLAGHVYCCTVVSNGRFTPQSAVDSIAGESCEVMGAFDTMYLRILDEAGSTDLPLTRGWWATGSANAFQTVEKKIGLRLMNLYGMTEACGNVTCTPLSWDSQDRSTSQGVPLPERTVQILHPETQKVLPPGVTGEVCVSGWGLMLGYYRLESETADALDNQGRLHTGDLACLDEENRLHFVGRLKEMLKVGGENVSTREVEDLYFQHPDVAEVAVIGLPHDVYGETPVAVVRLRTAGAVSEQELIAFAKDRIASFKVPSRVVLVEDFPRSSSTGKVRKVELTANLRTATQ